MVEVLPTIKGIFLKSHIDAVKREKGEDGLKLLEEKFGKPLSYKNSDNVPIREEVKLIECVTEILRDGTFPQDQLHYEAGKQHFQDFTTTPLAKIVLPFFKSQFKLVIMQAQNIAGHVFQGVTFESQDAGEHSVKLVMRNNDYPIDHFKGFFQAWMDYCNLHGNIQATDHGDSYEYLMNW